MLQLRYYFRLIKVGKPLSHSSPGVTISNPRMEILVSNSFSVTKGKD